MHKLPQLSVVCHDILENWVLVLSSYSIQSIFRYKGLGSFLVLTKLDRTPHWKTATAAPKLPTEREQAVW